MNINIENGEVELSRELIIGSGYSFEEFKKTPYYSGQDGIRTILLDGSYDLGGANFKVSLFFRNGIIYMVSLTCIDGDFAFEDEPRRKELHDRLLENLGIKAQEYSWGSIESVYDEKSNISSINIQYC